MATRPSPKKPTAGAAGVRKAADAAAKVVEMPVPTHLIFNRVIADELRAEQRAAHDAMDALIVALERGQDIGQQLARATLAQHSASEAVQSVRDTLRSVQRQFRIGEAHNAALPVGGAPAPNPSKSGH